MNDIDFHFEKNKNKKSIGKGRTLWCENGEVEKQERRSLTLKGRMDDWSVLVVVVERLSRRTERRDRGNGGSEAVNGRHCRWN